MHAHITSHIILVSILYQYCILVPIAAVEANLNQYPSRSPSSHNQYVPSSPLSPLSPLSPSSSSSSPPSPSPSSSSHNQMIPTQNNDLINPYTKAANDILLDLRQEMLVRSMNFDENFRHSLSRSKLSLHSMFKDTYGLLYEHNTEIFTSMFESLEQYYAHGQIKLTKTMENFFDGLYQKVFQVYNSYRSFTEEDLKCATQQISKLKPFKDVPDRLIEGVKRAFVSARTFTNALTRGIDVIKRIISVSKSES